MRVVNNALGASCSVWRKWNRPGALVGGFENDAERLAEPLVKQKLRLSAFVEGAGQRQTHLVKSDPRTHGNQLVGQRDGSPNQ